MLILFKQSENAEISSLRQFNISNCYLKKLSIENDDKNISKKRHRHNGFEIHFVVSGFETYSVGDKQLHINAGEFLLIPPFVPHHVLQISEHMQKFAVSFNFKYETDLDHYSGKITNHMHDCISYVNDELFKNQEISLTLIENRITELIIEFLRLIGYSYKTAIRQGDENVIISFAKQYIEDNISYSPNVSDVADYCNISARQLTRIFKHFEGLSPGEYITLLRIEKTLKLLADDTLSIKEISDKMHFNSEYYFNSFIKKHLGMPPGEYRRVIISKK